MERGRLGLLLSSRTSLPRSPPREQFLARSDGGTAPPPNPPCGDLNCHGEKEGGRAERGSDLLFVPIAEYEAGRHQFRVL